MINKENKKPRSVSEFDKIMGKRLKEKREERGFTQKQIAKQLNLTFQQIQKYEKGLNRIPTERAVLLAKFLGVDISYFIQDIDVTEASPVVYEPEYTQLIAELNHLSSQSIKDLLGVARAFRKAERNT